MIYIFTKQLLGGKYSKWIVILQEFDLGFEKSKSKKSLVFAELMCDFPRADTEIVAEEPIVYKSLFLISTLDPCCQIFDRKMRAPPVPLHRIITVGPFAKWGIDFITCNPHSAGGHAYIILAVDYFTKWAEAMPTFEADGKTTVIFVFNHIVARFGVPQVIITDHGHHFRNVMMTELVDHLGLRHDSSTPYYPQANGLVEAINKVLVIMIQRIIGIHRSNWHNMLFSALRAYRTSVKTSTGFTPFQLVYVLEVVLPIECEIPSLRMAIELLPTTSEEERCLLYLAQLYENRHDAALAI
eukprot:PITA_11583